jgi:hypothetical protein
VLAAIGDAEDVHYGAPPRLKHGCAACTAACKAAAAITDAITAAGTAACAGVGRSEAERPGAEAAAFGQKLPPPTPKAQAVATASSASVPSVSSCSFFGLFGLRVKQPALGALKPRSARRRVEHKRPRCQKVLLASAHILNIQQRKPK